MKMEDLKKARNLRLLLLVLLPLFVVILIILLLPGHDVRLDGARKYSASSSKNPQSAAGMAFDGKPETAWVPGKTTDPRYEWLQVDFSGNVQIKGLRIKNGFGSDKNAYRYGAKVHTLRLLLSDFSTYYWTLSEDEPGFQKISLSGDHEVRWIKFFIHSIYKGVNDPPEEVAISELEIR